MRSITHQQFEFLKSIVDKEILSAAEVAGILGYSRSHVYRLTRAGRIKVHKPNFGRLIYLKSEILEQIENS